MKLKNAAALELAHPGIIARNASQMEPSGFDGGTRESAQQSGPSANSHEHFLLAILRNEHWRKAGHESDLGAALRSTESEAP